MSDAKARSRKFLGLIKGKEQIRDKSLANLIQGAYYRSLVAYYFTPQVGAGVVSKHDHENFEIELQKKQILIPNFNNSVMQNVC